MFRVFVGWDSREVDAYRTCCYSIRKHTSEPVEIRPVCLNEMLATGIYRRPRDEPASTEFTYSRFLVPHLTGFTGTALFVDCDFLFTTDINKLWSLRDDHLAVSCVQHDYQPRQTIKMDGQKQVAYPRKNWSSLVLWNCSHAANEQLTPDFVGTAAPSHLHRFSWLSDEQIGSIPTTWNWLVGDYDPLPDGQLPEGIHFTNGGPWHPGYENVDYAGLWRQYREEALAPPTSHLISEEYRNQLVQMHEGCATFGVSSKPYLEMIRKLSRKFEITEILDYGCGKRLVGQHLGKELGIREYDPGLPGCAEIPKPSPMVVCLDVLEHIEPQLLDHVLDHLANLTQTIGLFSISTRPAAKRLPDGRNAHLIIQDENWWLDRIRQHFDIEEYGRMRHDEGIWIICPPIGTATACSCASRDWFNTG